MSTFQVATSVGIDMEWLFPGVRGGSTILLPFSASEFRVQYAADGQPGENLIVRFVSSANDLTYDGSQPNGGTFDQIEIYAADGTTLLATFTGDIAADAVDYLSTSLVFDLLTAGPHTYEGNAGADALYTFDDDTTLVGNGGDDTLYVGEGVGMNIHGSAADGSGGGGETDIIIAGGIVDFAYDLTFTTFNPVNFATNIDGFEISSLDSFDVDPITGLFCGCIDTAAYLLQSDFGTSWSTTLTVSSQLGYDAMIGVFFDGVGGTLDASLWQAAGAGSGSELYVLGSSGNDTVTGWGYRDIVVLVGGTDTVDTGGGDDDVFFNDASSGGSLQGGTGEDWVIADWRFAASGYTATGLGTGHDGMTIAGFEHLYFEGSDFDDYVAGTSGNDFIYTEDGDDTLISGTGPDELDGGDGVDYAIVDRSNATVNFTFDLSSPLGSLGLPILADGTIIFDIERLSFTAGSGNDTLSGGDLDDTFVGNGGRDALSGRGGEDQLFGGIGQDTLDGGDDNDTLDGGDGADMLDGGEGDDQLFGGAGNDMLDGSGGSDVLVGGAGGDTMDGGDGKDRVSFLTSSAAVGVNRTNSLGGFGDGYGDTFYNIEQYDLSNFDDSFIGSSENETVFGLVGDDTLDGGLGNDYLVGGVGNDTYVIDNINDIADESTGALLDVDLIRSWFTVALADTAHFKGNIENVTLLGAANLNATGNALANVLTGNSGANTLDGLAGADTMIGLAGNDLYAVRDITDIVDESVAGSGGIDRVNSLVNFSLVTVAGAALGKGGIEAVTLLGMANAFIYGNALANIFLGNAGSNLLAAGAGNDTLTGAGGNDFFLFNTTLNATTNVDTITDMNEAGDDTIQLENAVFTTLSPGALPVDFFRISTTGALDANDQIIYNQTTGELFYDANGNVAGGSTLFARLDPGLALTAADFVVV